MPTAPCQHISRLTESTIALRRHSSKCMMICLRPQTMDRCRLCLLDLTAEFDTVDHELLLARLERTFGVRSRVLAWFKSYVTGRTYCVIYAGASSSIKQVICSAPHGSVLGPLLFLLYTADLADLAAKHGVTLYDFADYTQVYMHCEFHNMATSRDVLKRCIQDIGHWMSTNLGLELDILSRLTDGGPRLVLDTEVIDASSFTCLLGMTFTPDLCLEKHASIVSGRCFFSATPVATCTTFSRLGSGIDAQTCIRLQLGWLLQLFNGGNT